MVTFNEDFEGNDPEDLTAPADWIELFEDPSLGAIDLNGTALSKTLRSIKSVDTLALACLNI